MHRPISILQYVTDSYTPSCSQCHTTSRTYLDLFHADYSVYDINLNPNVHRCHSFDFSYEHITSTAGHTLCSFRYCIVLCQVCLTITNATFDRVGQKVRPFIYYCTNSGTLSHLTVDPVNLLSRASDSLATHGAI